MERHAAGLEAELLRMVEHVDRHLRVAAELARQRPFRAGAAEQEAAEHLGAGRGAGDLLDLGLAVDREQPDAEREGARDVAFLLDRVAERDALGRGAGREHHLDLGDRGGVEAGAERDQQRQQLRRRVRLDGVEHPAVRQCLGKGADSCRARRRDRRRGKDHRPARRRGGGAESRGCARSSEPLLHPGSRGQAQSCRPSVEVQPPALARRRPASTAEIALAPAVRWRHGASARLFSRDAALDWSGRTRSARPARWTSLFGADLWRANETKKARSVVALSRVPR